MAYPGPYYPRWEQEDKTEIYPPRKGYKHTHTIILLHDLGYRANDFGVELFNSKTSSGANLPELFPNIRWILPTYSVWKTKKEIDQGKKRWFDMWDASQPRMNEHVQQRGLKDSIRLILSLVKAEMSLIPAEKIFLGGVGQGGAVAVHAVLSAGVQLGGFIGLSTWMPFQSLPHSTTYHSTTYHSNTTVHDVLIDLWGLERPHPNRPGSTLGPIYAVLRKAGKFPVYLAHARGDKAVSYDLGKALGNCLSRFSDDMVFRPYEHDKHWVNDLAGMDDLAGFIKKQAPPTMPEPEEDQVALSEEDTVCGSDATLVEE